MWMPAVLVQSPSTVLQITYTMRESVLAQKMVLEMDHRGLHKTRQARRSFGIRVPGRERKGGE